MAPINSLPDEYLELAQIIADELASAQKQINPNSNGLETELKHIIGYISNPSSRSTSSVKLFDYLDACIEHADDVAANVQDGRDSRNNAPKYYRKIKQCCESSFASDKYDLREITQILGWAARLIRYFKSGNLRDQVTSKGEQKGAKRSGTVSQAIERPQSKAWERPNR